MTRHRRVNTLSESDAAYIAGLMDGEGTIPLTRKHRNENRHLAVTIASCERHLLAYVLATVGAGKITGKRVSSPNHSPSYTFAIYNRQALDVLRQIQSFLRSYKARRCELAVNRYQAVTPRNGKYSEALRVQREQFERLFLAIRPHA